MEDNNLLNEIRNTGEEIEPELIEIRRLLHRHPEPSMKEYQTSAIIADQLAAIDGVQVYKGLAGGTGVMGILQGQAEGNGKCLLFRADIDALPVEEKNGLPFASENPGFMHACGHDSHASWVLGAAKILSRLRDQFSGTVKFVFQPGEEDGKGAREMVEQDHILENPDVDMAFAAHAWPSIDAGKIGIARRYAFGCAGGFSLQIRGKGGHGSWPHRAVNPILTASEIALKFSRLLTQQIDAVKPAVISVGSIHAGEQKAGNIIPDTCMMTGTIRAAEVSVMEDMIRKMEKMISFTCEADGCTYDFRPHIGISGVRNNPELVDLCRKKAGDIVGQDNAFIIEHDNLGGDNFKEISSRIPSCYFYVGIRNEDLAEEFSLHSPKFMLDESVIRKAAETMAWIGMTYLR
ncbi:MAG: M20 family metallopeptidase [Eubacterium sp.]